MTTINRLLAVIVIAVSAIGCNGGDTCDGDSDCSSSQVCCNGTCQGPPCGPCEPGEIEGPDGECTLLCVGDSECAPHEECGDGVCVAVENPTCVSDLECQTPGECETASEAACIAGTCRYPAAASGTACDAAGACNVLGSGQCDGAKTCVGQPVVCNSPPECHDSIGSCLSNCVAATGTCLSCSGCAHVCDYQPSSDGTACTDGLCIDGTCVENVCHIGGQEINSGTKDPANGCQLCDPAQSRTAWSTFVCNAGAGGVCREASGTCDPSLSGGSCELQDCCVYAPVWDGSGQAPTCAAGVCDVNGQCVGCNIAVECDDGNECSTDDCISMTCEYTALSTGSCTLSSTDDGLCVSGICLLGDGETCTDAPECASYNCEDTICCAAGSDCCRSDADCAGAYGCETANFACRTTCTSGADCQSSAFCNGLGECEDERQLGSACDNAFECASGLCADGVCCNNDCTGVCEACNLSGAEGACTPNITQLDPDSCPGSDQTCVAGVCVSVNLDGGSVTWSDGRGFGTRSTLWIRAGAALSTYVSGCTEAISWGETCNELDSATDWLIPHGTSPSSFEIRCTRVSGSPDGVCDGTTWLVLDQDRSWAEIVNTEGTDESEILLEIRQGQTILTGGNYTIRATHY